MDAMKSLYGTGTACEILLVIAIATYLLCRGNRYNLPRQWRPWVVCTLWILMAIPTVAFLLKVARAQPACPRTTAPQLGFHLVDRGTSRSLHD